MSLSRSLSRSSFESSPLDQAENNLRDRCINRIQKMDQTDFFKDQGPQQRLNQLVKYMEPAFSQILENKMPLIEGIIEQHSLEVRNVEHFRNNPDEVISFVDHGEHEIHRSVSKVTFMHENPSSSDMRKARSLSYTKLERSTKKDAGRQKEYSQVINKLIRKVFSESCKQLMSEHPLLEATISQVICAEGEAKLKEKVKRSGTMSFKHGATSKNAELPAMNVTLDLKSYMQHSETIKEITNSYESLVEQNKKLHERIARLKMQHDKETTVAKHAAMLKTDHDLKLLLESRLHRNNELHSAENEKSDNLLDDYEHKIVTVEWFDSLEGIEKELRDELNLKLAKVRNSFQDLLDTNLKSIDKLNERIDLMNKLSPDAYSVANISLMEIFKGVMKKEKSPNRIWKALKEVFGEDYFLTVVEAQYGKRFVANYNALFNEVNQVKEHAEKNIANLEQLSADEIVAQKRITQTLRQELSLFKENYRKRIEEIQESTKQALEKDFEQRESKSYQEAIKRENELQQQIEEQNQLFANSRFIVERIQKKRVLEKLKMIQLAKRLTLKRDDNVVLGKILGFLKGETTSDKIEVETRLTQRIEVLESMNKDLCNTVTQLDSKNNMLNDQVQMLDQQMQDIGGKITSAENKQLIAYEEKRKALNDFIMLKRMNDNLESSLESHEREKENLLFELRRFTKQKMRSNYLEAELYRKKSMHQIDKRAMKAATKMFPNVECHTASQTDLGGLKKRLIQMTEKDYDEKFCKTSTNIGVQTEQTFEPVPQVIQSSHASSLRIDDKKSTSRNALRDARNLNNYTGKKNQFKSGKAISQYGSIGSADGEDPHGSIQSSSKSSRKRSKDDRLSNSQASRGKIFEELRVRDEVVDGDMKPQMVDVAVTCDLPEARSTTPKRSGKSNRKKVQNLVVNRGGTTKNRQSESNQSLDHASFTKLHPKLSHRDESNYNVSNNHLTTLNEKEPVNLNDEFSDIEESVNQKSLFKVSKGKRQKSRVISPFRVDHKHDRLSAGWKIVNERLKDIKAIEERNKSQIKYEVDKAFEMTKYLDDTNFTRRDPRLSQAYNSLVQMCLTKLDSLSPFMILQKIEKEKSELQKILTVDPDQIKQNSNAVTKILNFVCLENLNSQILKIFTQVIKKQLPPSISDVDQAAGKDRKFSPVQIISTRNPSRLSSINVQKPAATQQLCRAHQRGSICTGVAGIGGSITPKDHGLTTRSNSPKSILNIETRKVRVLQDHNRGNSNDSLSQSKQRSTVQTASIPRRSHKSLLTIKSNKIFSASKLSVQPTLDATSETLVKHLLTDSRSLKVNIEKTFQSSNQAAVVQARLQAARCINSKGFQSLLTSKKLHGMYQSDGFLPKPSANPPTNPESKQAQEKRHYQLYRQKMKGFLNNNHKIDNLTLQKGSTRSSNLFKQHKRQNVSDVKHNSVNYDIQNDGQGHSRLGVKEERYIPEDGRKTVQIKTRKETDFSKVSPRDLIQNNAAMYQNQLRFTSKGLLPRAQSSLINSGTGGVMPEYPSHSHSFLDQVKSTCSNESHSLERNAYLNQESTGQYQTIQTQPGDFKARSNHAYSAFEKADPTTLNKSKSSSEIFMSVQIPNTSTEKDKKKLEFFTNKSLNNFNGAVEVQRTASMLEHTKMNSLYPMAPGLSTTSSIVVKRQKKRQQPGKRNISTKQGAF